MFDVDYTWIGIGSSHLGLDRPLYAESFWDDSYDWNPNMGKVWGLSRGLVPDPATLNDPLKHTLGPASILSTSHPAFGTLPTSIFDTYFALNSDGGSWNEFAFNTTAPADYGSKSAAAAFRTLRTANDFHPRAAILDSAFSCYGQFAPKNVTEIHPLGGGPPRMVTTSATVPAYRLTPTQQHCVDYGHKHVQTQNILDYYYDRLGPEGKFDFILFVDDQVSNLLTVKAGPWRQGHYYHWGPMASSVKEAEGAEEADDTVFTPDQVKVGFPHGGSQYLVQPRGNGSAPDGNCAGCFYVQASDPDGTSPYVSINNDHHSIKKPLL